MKLSAFGEKFGSRAGIISLMDDLGHAMAGGSEMIMMGGGNPAHVPEVQACFRRRMEAIVASESDFQRLIGVYDPPQGELEFIDAVCALLSREFGWPLKRENVALTNGSQAAFFMLFNMLGGEYENGLSKQIQLPLAPEYIGYTDAGIRSGLFKANRPNIEHIDSHTFKYHVDFEHLEIGAQTGAICVSRPTNPTGNVLTDSEMEKLDRLARRHDVPLIVDGAYGTPFPELIFTSAQPFWNENTILCLSLSKFGLPAARTGIVIAREDIIKSLSGMNAIMNLATGSFGSMMALDMVQSGDIIKLSRETVKPFYLDKAKRAEALLRQELDGLPFALHKVEGAMFLWLWLKDSPLSSQALYEKLKEQGVLVVPGHYFFPGLDEPDDLAWPHREQCLRITYSQDDEQVAKGIGIIGEVVRESYQEQNA